MKHVTFVGVMLAVVVVSGCASMPEYHAKPGEPQARINLKSEGHKWICMAGTRQRLKPDSTGYADIPAGSRVTIGAQYYGQKGMWNVSCNPRISLVPAAGQRYYMDFEMESERCYALIFREDAAKRTGLAIEPTLAAGTNCPGN